MFFDTCCMLAQLGGSQRVTHEHARRETNRRRSTTRTKEILVSFLPSQQYCQELYHDFGAPEKITPLVNSDAARLVKSACHAQRFTSETENTATVQDRCQLSPAHQIGLGRQVISAVPTNRFTNPSMINGKKSNSPLEKHTTSSEACHSSILNEVCVHAL